MRDDELTRVPKSIEPWRVMEFLESLGITPADVYETTIGVRAVTVRLYATDEKGHRYLGEDGKAAEHVVSVQYVGPWEKPSPAPTVEPEYEQDAQLAPAVCNQQRDFGDGTSPVCDRAKGHAGYHMTGGITWP